MAASLRFGITGRGCRDLYLEETAVGSSSGGGIRCCQAAISVDAGVSSGGGKGVLSVSADTLALAGRLEAGGGGVHSCVALRAALPEARVQYLDAGRSDPLVDETLAKAGIEAAYLGWRDVPLNLVAPDDLD
jgi:hypothetical protein